MEPLCLSAFFAESFTQTADGKKNFNDVFAYKLFHDIPQRSITPLRMTLYLTILAYAGTHNVLFTFPNAIAQAYPDLDSTIQAKVTISDQANNYALVPLPGYWPVEVAPLEPIINHFPVLLDTAPLTTALLVSVGLPPR